ncbi:type I restriction enzyme HsdR N-terminal domain-containing protein [Clostridium sp.]|uniref:type I restriction enzyme HsdR N-terminal domain-containing protein n=1 Tax=Clostridium sp. TaxID=1506 RepID=UPI00260CFC2B|nr:type I restriction enzyme HsdR N-terminal domain-containing protein [Clostridium sp.]
MPFKSVANEFEDEEVIESRDKKIFYVGMTRATELLFITSDGRPSKFMGNINYKYLRLSTNSNFRRVNRIDIDKYYFKDRILDVYSEEEKVRQWMIKELIDMYKYNIGLIEIEKPVSIGSRPGLVDIVVNSFNNKIIMDI